MGSFNLVSQMAQRGVTDLVPKAQRGDQKAAAVENLVPISDEGRILVVVFGSWPTFGIRKRVCLPHDLILTFLHWSCLSALLG